MWTASVSLDKLQFYRNEVVIRFAQAKTYEIQNESNSFRKIEILSKSEEAKYKMTQSQQTLTKMGETDFI